jgi:hypothetical protein
VAYIDDVKEKKFSLDRDTEAATHGKDQVKKLPISVQKEAMMFNPINNCVDDEARLNEKDQRELNKKARYQARH